MSEISTVTSKSEAIEKLAKLAEKVGGTLTASREFLDLPQDPNIVGYGIMKNEKGSYVICTVPR